MTVPSGFAVYFCCGLVFSHLFISLGDNQCCHLCCPPVTLSAGLWWIAPSPPEHCGVLQAWAVVGKQPLCSCNRWLLWGSLGCWTLTAYEESSPTTAAVLLFCMNLEFLGGQIDSRWTSLSVLKNPPWQWLKQLFFPFPRLCSLLLPATLAVFCSAVCLVVVVSKGMQEDRYLCKLKSSLWSHV